MRNRILVLAAMCLSACGSSTPSLPTPPTPTAPAPQVWSLTGTVVDTLTGTPIPGAPLTFTTVSQTQTSGPDGGWTLTGTGTAATRQAVTVAAPGYLTHETAVRWEQAGRRDIRLDLIPDRPPFSRPGVCRRQSRRHHDQL